MSERIQNFFNNTQSESFSYDHRAGLFIRGDCRLTPEQLKNDLYGLGENNTKVSVSDTPLAWTVLGPVMLPKMYDWLNSNITHELADETVGVMRDVFIGLHPGIPNALLTRDEGGFMGFDMQRLRPSHPHIILTTLGNCACLGVTPHGLFGERDWDKRVASFDFHNIDAPEQEMSLLAGLGHLAHRAAQD